MLHVMKRLFFICVFTAVAAVSAKASVEMVAPIDSLDYIGGNTGTGGGRNLSVNDLQVSVLDFLGTKLLIITVQSNLGTVDFTITNHNTGEYLDGELNAQPGSYPIPISGSSGNYTALFVLPDGRRVEREFVI